ncbi:MAG: autoinducer 2 ABC transporter substrate-binding protein [Roseitalea sp.]|jgi:simple sugar transport system substrate-binding protein|nr:autoinducer 2 ABC transporter substrate-binding protein [Oceaniradius stylonematis]MBO6553287.1 autoinducer 2 ABC transporter substrate-binding protein [Roseitalea sp.]MBO6950953.1 autoinducer 2 ABC transporter substrate-binding protein [Rhizobiaceae bacterium]RNC89159.1 MAG: autoinducer 2 ABC transporter substrate-binding protein [Oricola sp.]MBO6591060.1 autoinducer 2 ABC transporter substrate-binding protein [Roseitalea sp.]MBO6599682.1 autoinducer 2 ABC transporter substrate-binding pro
MKTRITLMAAALLAGSALTATTATADETSIATVVKIAGIQWFNRMEEGVNQFAEDNGVNAFQVGPAQADPQQQAALIEDMIAQGVDALAVVPMSPEALEPVLGRAMEQGITVITHEAAAQQNTNYDIEAFRNEDFGANLMEQLATCMGGEGEYAVFVGSLTSQTHNQWVDGAIAHQEANYPNMTLVGDKNETFDDAQNAYQKAQEVLRAFPNVKGMQGSASTDVAGIGLAIEERGMEDDTCVFGTSLPSIAGQYLETGAVDGIGFWDPSVAGYAMNKLAMMVMNGEEVTDGMDLGLEGYESVALEGKVIYGQAWVNVNKDNMADYPF